MDSPQHLEHVFVYGTLKRGQCRQACWPAVPARITQGWIQGSLIDLGPYPALVAGTDRVWGELWSFQKHFIAAVQQTLDQIEVYNQPGLDDEYQRVRTSVTIPSGQVWADTYRFVNTQQVYQLQPMAPSLTIDGHPYVVWPART